MKSDSGAVLGCLYSVRVRSKELWPAPLLLHPATASGPSGIS